MINQELVNYIKERIKGGAKEGEIHQSLLNVGWTEADIQEAFLMAKNEINIAPKTVELPKVETKKEEFINVVDLTKTQKEQKGEKVVSPDMFGGETEKVIKIENRPEKEISKNQASVFESQPVKINLNSMQPSHKKFKIIFYVVIGLFILGLIGLSVFLYLDKNKIEKQLVTSNSQQGDFESQIKSLTQTINQTQQEVNNLKQQNNDLLNQNNDLKNQLLLFSQSTSSLEVILEGDLLYEKNQYLLKTSAGLMVNIKNSKDKDVANVLNQFKNQKIKIKGMRTPGLREITISEINNESLSSLIGKLKSEETKIQTTTPTTLPTATTTLPIDSNTTPSSSLPQ